MSIVTAARPAHGPAAAKHATKAANALAGDRPLNPDEYDLAKAFVRRWQSARSLVAKLYGSADATSEYLTAVERYESFEGDEPAYMRAALKDRDMLSPDELTS